MNKQRIETLIDDIVKGYFPDEEPVYSLEKEMLFKNAWNNDFSNHQANGPGISQAGNATEIILGCIATVLGTIKTVMELYELSSKQNSKETDQTVNTELMARKWSAELQLAGLDIYKAEALTKQFSDDLKLLIKND